MLRIGLVDIETSHRNRFTDILHADGEAQVTCVCPGSVATDSEIADFVGRHRLSTFATPDAMAGEVDMAFILGTNWDRHIALAMPFIERGKPVFIDKPIVGNLGDCARLEELVAQGARIAGSSSLRYFPEFDALRDQLAAQNGRITYVSTIIGNHVFEYGIHAVEMLGGLLGTGARSVRYMGGEMPAVHHVTYADGARATLCLCGPKGTPICAEVASTAGYVQMNLPNTSAYTALMREVAKFGRGEAHRLAPISALTESIRIALAAEQSRRQGGREVALCELTLETAPAFDGVAFSAEYGAKKRMKK